MKFLKFHVNDEYEVEDVVATVNKRKIMMDKFTYHWNKAISEKLRVSKNKKNIQRDISIPTEDEISKFNSFVNSRIQECLRKKNETYAEYLELCR